MKEAEDLIVREKEKNIHDTELILEAFE